MAKRTKKVKNKVEEILGNVDVAFVLDTTGSMGVYIQEAKQRMVAVLNQIAETGDLNIKVAVVEYRDHPPQEYSFVVNTWDFVDVDDIQRVLNKLYASGGGDRPEAVWPGVKAVKDLSWRDNSERLVYLIGDSPPHGHCESLFGDGFSQGDPSGITHTELVEILQELRVKLHAHSIANHTDTTKAFELLTIPLEGELSTGDRPEHTTELYTGTLTRSSEEIATATAFYNTVTDGGTKAFNMDTVLTTNNGFSEQEIFRNIGYLNKRGVINLGDK